MATISKAIIFDMDGTLVDSEYEYLKRLESFLNTLGYCITLKDLAPVAGADDNAMWSIMETILHKTFDHEIIKKQFRAYLFTNPVQYGNILFNGIERILKKLEEDGYLLALASSSRLEHIFQMLDECHLRSYFKVVLSGEMFEKTKPDPAIYVKIVEKLNVSKENCIVIEDSYYGIQAARRAGLYTMARIETRICIDQRHASALFTTYDEAYSLIQKKNS